MPRPAGSPAVAAPENGVAEQVILRDPVPGDEAFLRSLHADIHPELATVDLPPDAIARLLELQITAQRAQYLSQYPGAHDQIACVTGQPVGRCWTHQSDRELRILDLAILRSHRRRGIARGVLAGLCLQATTNRLPLRLHVWHTNLAAQELYAQVGFHRQGEAAGYLAMEWLPGTAAPQEGQARRVSA